MRKRLLCIFLIVMCLGSSVLHVFATESSKSSGETTKGSSVTQEFKNAFDEFRLSRSKGTDPAHYDQPFSEYEYADWDMFCVTLKNLTGSPEFTAACLSYAIGECNLVMYGIQGIIPVATESGEKAWDFQEGGEYTYDSSHDGGSGHGVVQASGSLRTVMFQWYEQNASMYGCVKIHHAHSTYTSENHDPCIIPNGAGQAAFLYSCIQPGGEKYGHYKEYCGAFFNEDGSPKQTVDKEEAVNAFYAIFIGNHNLDHSNPLYAYDYALKVVNAATGEGGSLTGTDINQQLTNLARLGLIDEENYARWKTMKEDIIQFKDLMDLSPNEIYNLEGWKSDLSHNQEDSFLVRLGRIVTMIFGLFFVLWGVLIYVSYWFDRVNNFIDINLLSLISFGRLTVSPDETSTFGDRELRKGVKRTVNHRNMLVICLLCVAFGVFIISGTVFKVLLMFVNVVQGILN